MLNFVMDAWGDTQSFESDMVLPPDLLECLAWMRGRSAAEAMVARESMMSAIEEDAKRLADSGAKAAWLARADPQVREVAKDFNGPLFELLLKACSHVDQGCAELFRVGAPLYGVLPVAGMGTPQASRAHQSVEQLRETCLEGNKAILSKLTEDVHSDELYKQTVEEADVGRMSRPCLLHDVDLSSVRLSKRFAVAQHKGDGSVKVRCVDSCTESGVNPCTQPVEHVVPDGLDFLFEVMKLVWLEFGEVPLPFTVDVNSAYRRVPLQPDHRWAAYVVFMLNNLVYVAGHLAMPFGATSSVHSWNRVGAALVVILRVVLKIPAGIYVDDIHGVEREACIEHTTGCVVRLVKAILGESSVAMHKVAFGLPLRDFLGATVDADHFGVSFAPSESKLVRWASEIQQVLADERLTRGAGKKLAGKLSWSAQLVFCRVGRALLRPLYNIKRGEQWSHMIRSALHWWLEVLSLQVHQSRPWVLQALRPVQIFCDAASSPARLAAVVFTEDGRTFYTDCAPPQALLQFFASRADKQICGLELAAIALGLSTFGDYCRDRKVHVWSDNCGSECAVRKGSAAAWDHTCIVHAIWVKAAALGCHLRVDRVPTKVNIADQPSRGYYKLLEAVQAVRVRPCLDECFWKESAWDVVGLMRSLSRA